MIGASLAFGVVVMGYLTGTLGNVIPLPGGVGGVEGAIIGVFLAFGVDPGLAVAGVLGYRTFEYWLPISPDCSPTCGCTAPCGTGTTARITQSM